MSGSLRWLAGLFLLLLLVCVWTGAAWAAFGVGACLVGVAVVAWHERAL